MKDFIGFLLITGGLVAVAVAGIVSLSTHADHMWVAGIGLIVTVIGAAIVDDKQ